MSWKKPRSSYGRRMSGTISKSLQSAKRRASNAYKTTKKNKMVFVLALAGLAVASFMGFVKFQNPNKNI